MRLRRTIQGPIRTLRTRPAGYTLVEMAVAAAIFTLIGIAAYLLFIAALRIYANTWSVNRSHEDLRQTIDTLRLLVYQALDSPELVDASGVPVIGNGPAPGIAYQREASGPYILNAPANANSSSIVVKRREPLPIAGQIVNIVNPVVRAPIQSVSPSGSGSAQVLNLQFPDKFGTYATPQIASGTVAAKGIPVSVATVSYCIATAVTGGNIELRSYPDGLAGSYKVLGTLDPTQPGSSTPFVRTTVDGETRVQIDVNIRVADYSNQVKPFHRYMRINTALYPK